ncbi:MAG: outer membrane protein [Vicinamibacterales bacterium]
MRKRLIASMIVVTALAVPAAAGADVLLTPYAGLTFGSKTGNEEIGTEFELDNRWVLGGSLAIVGASGLGFEVDLGFIPDFFEPKDLDLDLLGTNNVTTFMGNVMFVGSTGGIRPYVTGGAGLIRSQLGDFGELFDATESSLGVNVGGGLLIGSGRVSLRGDVRYFRNVSESDDPLIDQALKDQRFWRGTVGVSFGF